MVKATIKNTQICNKCHIEQPIDNFYNYPSIKNPMKVCKNCESKRTQKWNNENKQRKKLIDSKYKSEERGYLINLYSTISKPSAIKQRGIPCLITKQEFFEQWMLHKERMGGIFCEYTGLPVTFNRGNIKGGGQKSRSATNLSVDRLDNTKPYSIENIVFCRADFNNRKNQVNLDDCLRIIKLAKERKLI
jgi:hypothetical protein